MWLMRMVKAAAAASIVAWGCAASHFAAADDLGKQPASEIEALQRRLSYAKCYTGQIDGRATPALAKAVALCPTQTPQLRIETGMHIAAIQAIGVDRECRVAATGSVDKSVRLWSLPDGRLLRTLHVPIGEADEEGKIHATAMSPDGHYVAAGGWDAHYGLNGESAVYVFDVSTGALAARVGGFNDVILSATFSPDGHWLAVTSAQGVGVHVIDTTTWRTVFVDKTYPAESYGVVFAPDGRLFTVAYDGKLRRYSNGPSFRKEAEAAIDGGKRPFSVAADPHGQFVSVSYLDNANGQVFDARTLKLAFNFAASFFDIGDLIITKTAWSRDGSKIITIGNRQPTEGLAHKQLFVFDRAGRESGDPASLPSAGEMLDIQPCADTFALASSDPAFGLMDGDKQVVLWHHGVDPNMDGKVGDAFEISADAKRIRFGLGLAGETPVVFDLDQATVADAAPDVPGLAPASTTGLPFSHWLNDFHPAFAGRPVALFPREISRALAIRRDRSGLVFVSTYLLHAINAQGKELWKRKIPAVAGGVNLSADGRIVVAAFTDGTVRWYRWSDGQELLALFVDRDTKAWVAWTPSGYYSASPGGEDLIGWQLNRGWEQAADFFAASKFRDTYARADIVEKILDTLDEAAAVRLANQARPPMPPTGPIIERLPPVIAIVAPQDDTKSSAATIDVLYSVRSPSGAAIDAVEALINGKPVDARGLTPLNEVNTCLGQGRGLSPINNAQDGCRGSLQVALPPGTSEIGLFARSGERTSAIARVRVTRVEAGAVAEAPKPKLFALVVGISDYVNPDYKLALAAKDATDFAAALSNQKGGIYDDVTVHLVTDRQATTAAIKDGLDWLSKHVDEHDIGIVYLAGHGQLDEHSRFYFMAADSDVTRLRATAVARNDISDVLDALPGEALLFLDACHAEAVVGTAPQPGYDFNTAVDDFLHSERGIVVFAGSTGRQVSLENPAWGNGAFTKALVEGLGLPGTPGKADFGGDGKITPATLDVYVARRVKELTHGAQSPVMTSTAPEFELAEIR